MTLRPSGSGRDSGAQRRRARPTHERAGEGQARPQFLLSGLLKCEECGSSYIMADTYRYGCNGYISRGASV